MRIGILTFHWATNYGAVLQAYALQHFLREMGHKTEIIDYVPLRVKMFQRFSDVKKINIGNFIKEHKIKKFREGNCVLSSKRFYSRESLKKFCHDYDVYICGSDQIWNQSFALGAEGKPTLSYYLDFVKNEKTRLSYAASFGTNHLPAKLVDLAKQELSKFKYISVRENTGEKIIGDMGLKARLDIDPTLLLERDDYEDLLSGKNLPSKFQMFPYILHNKQILAEKITDYIFKKFFDKNVDKKYNQEPIDMFEWLNGVKMSKLVVTNSFHGAIFSIIFHKPFFVIPVQNSGMNDRVFTLLKALGLEERLLDSFDTEKIETGMSKEIKWEQADRKLEILKKRSKAFLLEAIEPS